MTLQAFSFPFPETRFIRAGRLIYKFKIRAGSSYSGEEMVEGNFSQELEDIIRTVLGNLDSLQPFYSTHYSIFPYKKQWEGVSKVMCKHSEKKLSAYPFVLILYVEKNTQDEKQAEEKLSPDKEMWQHFCVCEPQSKRCKRHSPVEDTILKDLSEDIEAESKVSVVRWLNMNNQHVETEEDADKKQTISLLKSGESTVTESGSPGNMQPKHRTQNKEGQQQFTEEGENTDCVPGTAVSAGIVARLASHIFPFSWFSKTPESCGK